MENSNSKIISSPKNTLPPIPTIIITSHECNPYVNITGKASFGVQIKLFIDNHFVTMIKPKAAPLGDWTFSFKATNLERGTHSIYAEALDKANVSSGRSNISSFCISKPTTNATSTKNQFSSSSAPLSKDLESLVFQKTKPTSTSVNFNSRINTYIFISFIILIIIWILFVNYDLTKDQSKNSTKNINNNESWSQ